MKERLTGAIILVALMVLLVPELLTGPIRPESATAASSTAASSTPSSGVSAPADETAPTARAQPPLRSYTLTLGDAPPAAHDPAAEPAAVTPAQPVVVTPQKGAADESTPAPQAAATPAPALQAARPPAHPVTARPRAAASTGGWVVQLGSFASRHNADRLARSLERKGFRMSVSPARAGARVLWRVRAGPAHDRAGAEHLAARLRALGHRGELLPAR